MSVEAILSSESKIEILRTLSGTTRSFSAEELEKETTKNIAAVYRALESLKREGVVEEIKTKGKTGYHRLNHEDELGSRVEEIFLAERKKYRMRNLPKKVMNILFNLKAKLSGRVDDLWKIILFGSAARGDFSPGSDLDLYIVVEKLDSSKEDKIHGIIEKYDYEFSLVVKSKKEYVSEFEKPLSSLAQSIIKEGYIELYTSAGEDRLMFEGVK